MAEHKQVAGNWRSTVNHEIDQLGWRAGTRIEQPEEDITIYIIDVMLERDMTFMPEGPATFSLSIFLDGSGNLSVDGAAPLEVIPGTAVLFACNHVTRGENTVNAGRRLHVVDIRFEAALLEKLGGVSLARLGGDVMTEHSLPDQDVFLIGFKAPPELLAAASALVTCRFESGMARRLYLYSKAIEALGIGIDTVSKRRGGAALRALNNDEMRKLENAVALIESQYSHDWSIAKLSREVGLNERRLKEAFRLKIGKSVHAYLRSVRIDAAGLLIADGVSVTQAAYTVGFDNLSHFSKVFRDLKGVLPSHYGNAARSVVSL